MRPALPACVLCLVSATLASAARPVVAVPPAGAATPPAVSSDAIDKQTLLQMYRRELSDYWRPELGDKLYEAHGRVEQYFAEPRAVERANIAKRIEAIGLDPNLVGRLTRIRLYWPQLAGGVYYVNERVGPHSVIYFVGVPENYDRTRPWPLVIKLPGVAAFLADPPPTAEQVVHIYTDWLRQELKDHPDAVVLMPLLNLDELWGPSYPGMNNVIQPMHHVAGRFNIDPRRVYLVGHSMSAYAAWNLAVHHPTYFTGLNAFSGAPLANFQIIRLRNLRNIYALAWHDAGDTVSKVQWTRDIVRLLRQFKYDVEFEETKNIGHAPSEEIARRLYEKMRNRSRELYPPEVALWSDRPDSLFNRADWVQVYQPFSAGGEQRLRLARGTGPLVINRNTHSAAAAITSRNRIEVKSENVESMRFYLNDQLVEFRKPITVIVNGKGRFEGMVKPSVEEMLKDQVYLGRGWRYYTGFIDIDFSPPPATRPATRPASKGIIEYKQ